uniref:Uncharacterized protein n=1 Tax=Opuntia streptacantha TaxID=393608 RepID=A0A7C9E2C5_OPUST
MSLEPLIPSDSKSLASSTPGSSCCNNSAPGTSIATLTSPYAFGLAFGSVGCPRSFFNRSEGQSSLNKVISERAALETAFSCDFLYKTRSCSKSALYANDHVQTDSQSV